MCIINKNPVGLKLEIHEIHQNFTKSSVYIN